MRFSAFASRNSKELLRDPLSLIFCIGLPLFLLVLVVVVNRIFRRGNIQNRELCSGDCCLRFFILDIVFGNADWTGQKHFISDKAVCIPAYRIGLYSRLFTAAFAHCFTPERHLFCCRLFSGIACYCPCFDNLACSDSSRGAFYRLWFTIWQYLY